MIKLFRPAAMLVCLFATGCVTAPLPDVYERSDIPKDQLWKQQQQANQQLISWQLKGKIGVKTGQKGGSATLNWSYLRLAQDIKLYGPFGGGRIHITAAPDHAVLTDSKGHVIEGPNAQDVLYQRLGWHVPFEEMIMWARGLPNLHSTDIEIDELGLLKSLNQGIWHVEYQEYRDVNLLTLPRQLTITSLPDKLSIVDDKGNHLGDELRVKVVLKRWRDMIKG